MQRNTQARGCVKDTLPRATIGRVSVSGPPARPTPQRMTPWAVALWAAVEATQGFPITNTQLVALGADAYGWTRDQTRQATREMVALGLHRKRGRFLEGVG